MRVALAIGPPLFAGDAVSLQQAAERWIAERLAIYDEAMEPAAEPVPSLGTSLASMSLP